MTLNGKKKKRNEMESNSPFNYSLIRIGRQLTVGFSSQQPSNSKDSLESFHGEALQLPQQTFP